MKGFLLFAAFSLGSCPAQLIKECPPDALIHPCECSSQRSTKLFCNNVHSPEELIKALTGFQEPTELDQLIIGGSSLTYLPPDVFRPIRANIFTVAENANLSYIDEDAFAGSEDFIRVLHLYLNNLHGVDVFFAMAKMEGLVAAILRGNSLSTVPERAFAGLRELAHVDLSINRISSLGREAFADCPKLTSIVLSNNELRVLPGRLIATDGLPVSLGDRVSLVLSDNQIDMLEHDALEGIKKSVDITLNRNQLRTLPKEIYQPLLDRLLEREDSNNIFLHGNPFVCDCKMRWVLENRIYFKILHSILCFDTKKPLESYSLKDFEQCLL